MTSSFLVDSVFIWNTNFIHSFELQSWESNRRLSIALKAEKRSRIFKGKRAIHKHQASIVMHFNAPKSFMLGTLASLAGPVSGFWRMSCPSSLLAARMDPIIDPGKVSGHVHTIAGGSGFDYNMTYQQARDSKCSTCPIQDDLSNYWTPLLYFRSPKNGSFTAVPQAGASDGTLGGMTVYYQLVLSLETVFWRKYAS